jgi:hypothetical protein
MPFGVQKQFQRLALPKPEILQYPLETTVIDSAVINATGVVADASGPYIGRRYLLSGTILSKRGDSQYERFTKTAGQTAAAILFDTVEFADGTDASDEPVAILRRNVSFDKLKIVDFATYTADLATGLPTCEFV